MSSSKRRESDATANKAGGPAKHSLERETRLESRGASDEAEGFGAPRQNEPNGQSPAESVISSEGRALEMIAGGARLGDVLDALCDTIDAHSPGIISTVLLMDPDGKRLWPAAGRRVPASWREVITPLPVGPDRGSCGTAAFLKEPVIVSDIGTDRLFDRNRETALRSGLRAAWSQPLISKTRKCWGPSRCTIRSPVVPAQAIFNSSRERRTSR